MKTRSLLVLGVAAALAVPLLAEEPVDLIAVTRIREEGFTRSKVMETLGYLADVIGPRVTGSPAMKRANEWTRDQLQSWGLVNAHLESYPFGRGWTLEHAAVHMVAPTAAPLIALPKAWTPGTDGPQKGAALKAKLDSEADLERWKGKLAGKVVFLNDARELKGADTPLFTRYTDQQLEEIGRYDILPRTRFAFDREAFARRFRLAQKLREYLTAEKVLATVEISARDGAVVQVGRGGSWVKGENPGPPALVMAAEHYNRVARLLDRNLPVEIEVDVRTAFQDDDPQAYNTIAEIPGTDKKAGEVVMVGGHLDSWHAGTGATDNAAGVAVAMEAVRILQALDVKPRRTIRIGLWSGEEEGLLGSRAYVAEHFGRRAEVKDAKDADLPAFLRPETGPLTLKPEQAKISTYFNFDNGTGKIRGIYGERNAAVAPIFEAWLRPLHDVGATTVTLRHTGGTDHLSFDAVGIPGFQFIQDEADYETRTHHTNLDVYDRLQKEDLMQASVVMAAFLYDAAMRDTMMPRRPLPPEPAASPAASPSPAPGKRADRR